MRFSGFEGEWEEYQLEEVIRMVSGGTPSMQHPEYWEGNIPFISAVSMHETTISSSAQYITEKGLKNGSKLLSKGNLLLLVRGSMLWKQIPICYNNIDVAFNQDVKGLIVNNKSTSLFMLYWFQAKESLLKYMVSGTGIGAGKLDSDDLSSLPTSIANRNEQSIISSFLSLIDERIQTQSKIIEELKLLKNTLSKNIFSRQLRFKDNNGADFPEWEIKEVGEVFKITRGNVLAMNLVESSYNEKMQYPVYSSQTKSKGLAGYYKDFLFENAITWTTDGANAGDVNYRSGKFYCTNVCGVLINEDGYANVCIAELINSVSRNYVSYVGNPKLMNGIMSEIKIPFPSIQEQQKIANLLSTLDAKIDIEVQLLQKLDGQKKYLLTSLFI